MTRPIVAVRSLVEDLPLPEKASEHASGYDLRAAVDSFVVIPPGKRLTISTGMAVSIPPGLEGQVRPRSGLANRHGVTVLNSPGTIDSDYRGEIRVILINHGDADFRIERGDRIAQLVFAPVASIDVEIVKELDQTDRGEGGFGSTGTN